MPHQLPELPYAMDALEPHISKETLEFHYGKHHQAYVDKLNAAIANGDADEATTLEQHITSSTGGVFNNAAQVWNHTFYWNCLAPNAGGAATGEIADKINEAFGSFDQFKETFSNKAATNFGSGWTWLVKNKDGQLAIVNTDDADNPLREDHTPLLTCDVWEHAYYIDYRNARPKYVEAFWNLVNWDFVNSQL